jgi:hypothetical protein
LSIVSLKNPLRHIKVESQQPSNSQFAQVEQAHFVQPYKFTKKLSKTY